MSYLHRTQFRDALRSYSHQTHTNNVKSCKKINEKAQTANFNVSSRLRQEQEKLKSELLKILTCHDLPRVTPCERACPQLSDYVQHTMV